MLMLLFLYTIVYFFLVALKIKCFLHFFQLLWNFEKQVQNKIKNNAWLLFWNNLLSSSLQRSAEILDNVHANNAKWALFIFRKTLYSQKKKKKQQHSTIPRSFRNSLFYWYVLLWILIFTLDLLFYLNIYSFKQYQSAFILHMTIKLNK